MKPIRFSIIFSIILLGGTLAFGQSKCFENNGLKDAHSIEFSINGKNVTGSFGIAPDYDGDRVKRYDFSGTISGSMVTVKFADQTPDALPASPAAKTWTLVRTAGAERLRVMLYGKNYNTNKWGNYTVDYRSCLSPYAEASSTAKRVSFAKGSSSWSADIGFRSKGEKKSYLLGLARGQKVSVSAPGCGISFFYPDKTPYEEGTAIDTWGSDSLPQAGDYLFVISPAGEPGTCTLRFEAR